MRAIAMRRMKTTIVDGKPILDLPKKTVQLETLTFSKEEKKVYEAMEKDGRIIIGRSGPGHLQDTGFGEGNSEGNSGPMVLH